MLVTAAAFPIAVKRMENSGSKAAMQQLSENSALLVAVLAPKGTQVQVGTALFEIA